MSSYRSIFSSPLNPDNAESLSYNSYSNRNLNDDLIYKDAIDSMTIISDSRKTLYSSPIDFDLFHINQSFDNKQNDSSSNFEMKNQLNTPSKTNDSETVQSTSSYFTNQKNASSSSYSTTIKNNEYLSQIKNIKLFFSEKFFKRIVDIENLAWKYQFSEPMNYEVSNNDTILKILQFEFFSLFHLVN
jgi:hypothetical protein